MDAKTKIVFVGAGPTTLGGTYHIHELIKSGQLDENKIDVTVLEKEAVPGGLARSITDEKGFSWDMGVHIFGTTKYPCFTKAIEEAVKDWNSFRRSVKVWTVDLEDMNSSWVGERVATIDLKNLEEMSKKDKTELLRDNLGLGPNTWFRYPKILKGAGFTWVEMVKLQPQNWFNFNQEVVQVDPVEKQVTTKNQITGAESQTSYDHLISTMPINLLGKVSSLAPEIGTKYSKVVLVGLGLKKPQSEWAQSVSWIYYPSSELVFYRCTIISNFNDHMTPDPAKYWSVICEVGLKPDDVVDKDYLINKTIEGLISRNMFDSSDMVEDVFFMVLPYGYPIPTISRDDELKKAHEILEKNQIYSRGRFGGWKYEVANLDHSFAQGYEMIGRILLGDDETVYRTGL